MVKVLCIGVLSTYYKLRLWLCRYPAPGLRFRIAAAHGRTRLRRLCLQGSGVRPLGSRLKALVYCRKCRNMSESKLSRQMQDLYVDKFRGAAPFVFSWLCPNPVHCLAAASCFLCVSP